MLFTKEFGNNIYTPFLEKLFFKPISRPLAKFFLKFKVHPNIISLVGLFLMIFACFLVIFDFKYHLIFAASMVYLSFLFDKVDGDLARLSGLAGPLGQYFEGFLDLISDTLMVIALIAYSGFNNSILISLTVIAPFVFYYNHLSSSLYLNLAPSTYRSSNNGKFTKAIKGIFSYNRVRHELLFILILLSGQIYLFFYIMPLLILYTFLLYSRRLILEYKK